MLNYKYDMNEIFYDILNVGKPNIQPMVLANDAV